MLHRILRQRTWIFLAMILLAGLVPAFSLLHSGRGMRAHAQGTPTVTISPTIVHFGDILTVTAQGFAASEMVQLQIEDQYTNTWVIGTLPCDGTGTCAGPVKLNNGCAGGVYTLIVTGESSQLQATTSFTTTPKIFINSGTPSSASGGPGAPIYVSGDGFVRNEGVLPIYWGTPQGIKEGVGVIDQCGNLLFQFNAPTTLPPGAYQITVVRHHMKPAVLGTIFHLLPSAIITTPSTIAAGQPIQMQLQGFANSEQVTVTWNANGGQQVAATGVSDIGSMLTTITPLAAPQGTYTLTARGTTSGLQATTSLTVVPGIQVTPLPANPGSAITVAGGGFAANEAITVYFQTTSGSSSAVIADATGSFTTALTLPTTYKANGRYSVYAKSVSGTNQASARVLFTTPTLRFTYPGDTYDQQTVLTGQGFAANETVKLFWNYKQTGQLLVNTATATSAGTVEFTVNMPSDPNLGTVFVAAVGQTSGITAMTSTPEQAALFVTPSSGPAGTTIKISGGGFGSFDQVTVWFNGVVVATRPANVQGAFTATLKVPAATATGVYTVGAHGQFSQVGVNTAFTVPPFVSINPTTGPSGTQITVSGSKFTPSGVVDIDWYDPYFGGLSFLLSVTASPTGTFTATVTAPSNLVSGNVYAIEVRDSSGAFGQAQFTAQ